jgi:adenylate cyclase
MNRKQGNLYSKLLSSVIIWLLAAILFGFFRAWGVESLPAYERIEPFVLWSFLFQLMILGMAIGIPFGIIDFLLDASWLRKQPYWKIILIKSVVQMCIAVFAISMLVFAHNIVYNTDTNAEEFIFSKTSLIWIIYTWIISFLVYFLEVVKTKIGSRVLLNLILGKYHNPRVETRVFMFLDMKDSTTHAENLGHIKFSSLIQDSLNDLTNAIIEHKVEVYQYVGDEAVLTWNLKEAFQNANCLQAYYTFMATLNGKKEYYENTYGFVPFFKAGVHLGDVTVSEVGIIKREIAYHSDVLNTAARIQGQCNEFEAELLISEELKDNFKELPYFVFHHIGGIALKGKQQLVNIYKVKMN